MTNQITDTKLLENQVLRNPIAGTPIFQLVFLFIGSISIPYLLGGLRLAFDSPDVIFGQRVFKNKKNRIFYSIIIIFMSPFHMAFLFLKQKYYEAQLLKHPLDKKLNEEWEKVKYHLCQHIRMELGLETIFQLSGQLILLFNCLTETGTHEGLDMIFQVESTRVLSIILLILSSVMSFLSCCTSNLKALISQREYFPLKSKAVAGLYTLFACCVRVLVFIMYFAPTLGLFNLLRHLQAEQTQWDPNIIKHFVRKNNTIQFGNSTFIPWKNIDRWTNHNGTSQPPNYTLYTSYNLLEHFYGFCVILFMQSVMVYMAKWRFSKAFAKSSRFEKLIHTVENIHLPYNFEEWDAVKSGGIAEHVERMKDNTKEVVSVMIINFIFNFLLLFPLGNLGKYLRPYSPVPTMDS